MAWATFWATFSQTHLVTLGREVGLLRTCPKGLLQHFIAPVPGHVLGVLSRLDGRHLLVCIRVLSMELGRTGKKLIEIGILK
jgi:hypothetical protein